MDCGVQSLLSASLNIARSDVLDMTDTIEQMENFITLEIVVRDIIYDADT